MASQSMLGSCKAVSIKMPFRISACPSRLRTNSCKVSMGVMFLYFANEKGEQLNH